MDISKEELKTRKFQISIFIMLISYATVFISNFLLDIISSRIGGPSLVGTVNLTRKWAIIIATLLELGIISTLPKFIAEKKRGSFFKISILILIGESLITLFLGIILYLFLPFFLNALEFGLIAASSVIVHGILYSICRGRIDIKSMFLIQFSFSVSRLISFIIFIYFNFSLFNSILFSFAIIPIIAMSFVIPIINLKIKNDKSKNQINLSFSKYYKFTAPIYISSIIAIVAVELDAIMIGFFFNSFDVGLYLVAVSLIGILNIVNNAVNVLLLPKISKNSNKRSEIIFYTVRSIEFFLLLYIPIFCIFFFYPESVIFFLYGSGYSQITYITMRVLVISAFFSQISSILIEIMIGLGKSRNKLIGYMALFFSKLPLLFLFIPFFSIIGISLSVFISEIIQFVIILFLFKKLLKNKFPNGRINIKSKKLRFWIAILVFCIVYYSMGFFISENTLKIMYGSIGLIIIFIIYVISGKIAFIWQIFSGFKKKKPENSRNLILSNRINRILNKITKAPLLILDDGCGSADIIKETDENNYKIGIEPNILKLTKVKNLEREYISLIQAVGEALPFKKSIFDFIISQMVLEHCYSAKNYIQENNRVLKKSKFTYISIPNRLFPIEPHLKIPLITYFPLIIFKSISKSVNHLFTYPKIVKILKVKNSKVYDINLFILKKGLLRANKWLFSFTIRHYSHIKRFYSLLRYFIPSWAFLLKNTE
ncbi:MAG: methyltransferase domain-containing protein [Promethearchaeota archaeon]|nr:MAG: methyltransferase domain-containing protein [Candidatus Lokiarchaeota archaeon]